MKSESIDHEPIGPMVDKCAPYSKIAYKDLGDRSSGMHGSLCTRLELVTADFEKFTLWKYGTSNNVRSKLRIIGSAVITSQSMVQSAEF